MFFIQHKESSWIQTSQTGGQTYEVSKYFLPSALELHAQAGSKLPPLISQIQIFGQFFGTNNFNFCPHLRSPVQLRLHLLPLVGLNLLQRLEVPREVIRELARLVAVVGEDLITCEKK